MIHKIFTEKSCSYMPNTPRFDILRVAEQASEAQHVELGWDHCAVESGCCFDRILKVTKWYYTVTK